MTLKRLGVQMDEELILKIDIYAKEMHISRTAALSVIVSQHLQQLETVRSFKVITDEMEKQKLLGL